MSKRIGIAKGKKAHESNSFLAPWKPKNERPLTTQRANEIERLLTTHGGDFTAGEICSIIDWCNKDNIRSPMRKLITEGRARIDADGYPLRFSAPPNTSGTKQCLGNRKDGQRCGWQLEQSDAHDYCQYHRKQDPNHWSNHRVDRSKDGKKKALMTSFPVPYTRQEDAVVATALKRTMAKTYNPQTEPADVIVVPDTNRMVADVDEPWTILVPTDRHNELIIKLLKPEPKPVDNKYRDLILSFLDGEATISDLREAVKDLQEELKE